MGFAVLVKPLNREKIIPIFIGPLETYSISSAMQGEKAERPLTHDLMKASLMALNYKIEKVFIDEFRSGTFFAKIFLESGHNISSTPAMQIDARPSDAIAMALRFKSPIFVTEHIYEQTAITLNTVKSKASQEEVLSSIAEGLPGDILSESEREDLLQAILEEFGEIQKKKVSRKTDKDKIDITHFKSHSEVLQQMLSVAVAAEKYEDAAKIRDELTNLEG